MRSVFQDNGVCVCVCEKDGGERRDQYRCCFPDGGDNSRRDAGSIPFVLPFASLSPFRSVLRFNRTISRLRTKRFLMTMLMSLLMMMMMMRLIVVTRTTDIEWLRKAARGGRGERHFDWSISDGESLGKFADDRLIGPFTSNCLGTDAKS